MNAGPMPGRDEHDRFFDQVVSQFDAPAYVRRGRHVQHVYEDLLESCRVKRAEWLAMPNLRLGQLSKLAGDWDRLAPLLADAEQVAVLCELEAELQPRLRIPVEATASERQLRGALCDLADSLERFNRRWLHIPRESRSEAGKSGARGLQPILPAGKRVCAAVAGAGPPGLSPARTGDARRLAGAPAGPAGGARVRRFRLNRPRSHGTL